MQKVSYTQSIEVALLVVAKSINAEIRLEILALKQISCVQEKDFVPPFLTKQPIDIHLF